MVIVLLGRKLKDGVLDEETGLEGQKMLASTD